MDQEASTPKMQLQRVGWNTACMKQNAERKRSLHGPTCREDTRRRVSSSWRWLCWWRQTKPLACTWSEFDAQHLLISMRRPETANRGVSGDLSSRFFEIRATRLLRSHLTAKELDIACSTCFEMRGNIIEAHLAAVFAQPKREFLPLRPPAHRRTRQQRRSELLEQLRVSGHVIKRRSGET